MKFINQIPQFATVLSLLLQPGDHVVESGALLHEVVDLLADGAVGGERRVEVDHDAVQPVLQHADAVRHVALGRNSIEFQLDVQQGFQLS